MLKGRLDDKLEEAYQASGWNVLLPSFLKHYNDKYKKHHKDDTNGCRTRQERHARKANILLMAKHERNYPPLGKGDEVQVYKSPEKRQYE